MSEVVKKENDLRKTDESIAVFTKSLDKIIYPSFLCKMDQDNKFYLRIIYCNSEFYSFFNLSEDEVINESYDFLFQGIKISSTSTNKVQYIRLLDAVKKSQPISVKIGINYPKNHTEFDKFKVSFIPNKIDDNNRFSIFTFSKLSKTELFDLDDNPHAKALIQNLERSLQNEKLLRQLSHLIASDASIKRIATSVAKTICDALKVDRVIIHNDQNGETDFMVESCGHSAKTMVNQDNIEEISKYINFQRALVSESKEKIGGGLISVDNNVRTDKKFEQLSDFFKKYSINSQVSILTYFDNKINGGIYIHQSNNRKLNDDEMDLLEMIVSYFAMAIDHSHSVDKIIFTNHQLLEKTIELRAALKKEQQMRKMQSQFIAVASHEFKTPLQIIDGARELMERTLKKLNIDTNIIDKFSKKISNATKRMLNLINSTLNLSKIEMNDGGDIKLEKVVFVFKEFIDSIIEKNIDLATERNIKISCDIDPNIKEYKADQKLLEHCFNNVLSNAIKYSKDGSSVEIEVLYDNEFLVTKITDHGIGIPEGDVSNVGKKFFRAGNTLSVAGTGIGMYLSKYFLERHHGSLEITSKLNVGTSVLIKVPKDTD